MSTASKTKRIKLVFGIAIPVLVLVTTIVMVSMSFAWFSQETTASIQSINLATQKAFVLEFGSSSATNDNLPYMGQEALGTGGYLIDLADPAKTNRDAPYYFVSEISISTQGETKSLSLHLDSIKILNGGVFYDVYVDSIPATGEGPTTYPDERVVESTKFHLNSKADLAFTWFFKSRGAEAGTNKTQDNENKDVMKSINPSATGEETWYTPFGTMVFENGSIKSLNGEKNGQLPETKQNIINFQAGSEGKDDTKYDFYIIFAPERIFWSQFFGSENRVSVDSYKNGIEDEDRKEILGNYYDSIAPTYRMYYSEERYQSSTFSFNATLTVIDTESHETTP